MDWGWDVQPTILGSLKNAISSSLSLLVRVVTGAVMKVEFLLAFLREMKISFSCTSAEVVGLYPRGKKASGQLLTVLEYVRGVG